MSNITEFVKWQLYPNLFDRIDVVFPDMKFTRYGSGWQSPLCMDGGAPLHPRKDKSRITRKYPNRVIEQGGGSKDLITLYKDLNGLSKDIDAIKAIASIIGLQLPTMEDSESYRIYREKQEQLEAIAASMRSDLYTDGGSQVLDYLRNIRGYDEAFIEYAEFGYCSKETAAKLRPLFDYTDSTGNRRNGLQWGVGETFTLSMPYRSGGQVLGFIFRSLSSDGQRYSDVFLSGTANKRYHLFGLTTLSPIDPKEWDKTITIVEGEIDALRAQFVGCANVVAASGGSIGAEALQEAKRIGATGVTILFDREATATGQASTDEKIKRAIDTIKSHGLTPFVAILPQEQEGVKVDVDSYLRGHRGEDLKAIISQPESHSIWKFRNLTDEFRVVDANGGISYPNFDEFKRRTIQLANSSAPVDRDMIFSEFSNLWEGGYKISKEAIQEEADRLKGIEDARRQKSETLSTISEAYQLANTDKEGAVEEAYNHLQERLPQLRQMSKAAQFGKLLLLPTPESTRAELKERPTGIATSFAFGEGDRREQLILPSGALTYICAPTSHGKSRMLQNLAIQLATNGGEGDVLYFSFEEDAAAVKVQLLNTYIGESLSKNNLRSINTYYRTGANYFYKDGRTQDLFKSKEAMFMGLLSSGKLRVFYEDYDSSDLIQAVNYLSKQIRVKAVFVDYIQLLHTRGSRLQRKDELKQICKDLMQLSIDIKAPVVLAAQLNREALSPVEMAVQNIAEASDIEHSANIVLLLWNSSVKPLPKSSGYFQDKGKEEKLTKDAQRIADKGFTIGTEGKLYGILAKNRGGARNIDAVFDFNGNTGRISQPSYTPPTPQTQAIPFEPPTDDEDGLF